ncbi:hypothetical protein O6H91_04G125400 [Diphasiastrum complanatum]|uniref:Uncharacterized protein n=4 Tax=Diphasiastrum complanatum TaxID=34168 RepID=A0ACC2E1V0_DIPCM|nr:hypothetical protein O6H91_04G125400 [Diphasiastrum complanatum]KAJ7560343.1 hypothetical protein O6H91_04G125400 [Diphasiastrum complanatum]KAJ7560344.1 hypothetical protein O6H91_04G125400 [Diphasiastrum complanatum]KAJ7560345.1 hypothetical protein O6H91_04G125400 [Diphasiastrum complanatum]
MKGILSSNFFKVAGVWNHGLEARIPRRKRLQKIILQNSRKMRKLAVAATEIRQQAEEEVAELEEHDEVGQELEDNAAVQENMAAVREHADEDAIKKIKAVLQKSQDNAAPGQVVEDDKVVEDDSEENGAEDSESERNGAEESDSEKSKSEESDSVENNVEDLKLGEDEADIRKEAISSSMDPRSDLALDVQMQAHGANMANPSKGIGSGLGSLFEESCWHAQNLKSRGYQNSVVDGQVEYQKLTSSGSSVEYRHGGAIVFLFWKDFLVFDGCATVCVLQGRASMLGYSLVRGMDKMVCSNFKLSSAVTIEPYPYVTLEGKPYSATELGLDLNSHEPTTISEFDTPGCILEFRSYKCRQVSALPAFTSDHYPASERITFRLEVLEKRNFFGQVNKSDCEQSDDQRSPDNHSLEFEGDCSEGAMAVESLVKLNGSTPLHRKQTTEGFLGLKGKKLHDESKDFQSQPTRIPSTWQAAINTITLKKKGSLGDGGRGEVAPITVICGAKGTGKSTFAKFLVNELLNIHKAVGYLDTDVGQPEFTIPGCLSLHILQEPIIGSPILHLRTPEKCYFYGDISPKVDPTQCIGCIQDLYDYFCLQYYDNKEQAEQTPLVVNTHGWLKGVGLDVLVSILRITKPTHVVHLVSSITQKNIPSGRFWQTDDNTSIATKILSIESYTDSSVGQSHSSCDGFRFRPSKNAVELRALRIMAYFQKCHGGKPLLFPCREVDLYAETSKALASQTPYQVSLSDIKVMHLHCQVPETQTLYSINAELVGLGTSPQKIMVDGTILPPECLGFGIVRGIDVTQNILYLITPLSGESLQSVEIILHGRLQIPMPLLQVEGYICPYLCRNSVVVEGTGSAVMRSHKRQIKPQMNGSL